MSDVAGFAFMFGLSALTVAGSAFVQRRKVRKAVEAIRRLRRLLGTPYCYREATLDDVDLLARLPNQRTAEASSHAIQLGDVILEWAEYREPCRAFVDTDRTTLLLVEPSGITAGSYGQTVELLTQVRRNPFALPPTVQQQTFPASATVAEILGTHRDFIAANQHEPLLRFRTLADAIDAVHAARDRRMAWRDAQDPNELFQKDLQMMFGPKAKPLWERIGPLAHPELPRAKARSVR